MADSFPAIIIPPRSIVATVTAYVSNKSEPIPAKSPTLSPTLSAITAGFLGFDPSGIPALRPYQLDQRQHQHLL